MAMLPRCDEGQRAARLAQVGQKVMGEADRAEGVGHHDLGHLLGGGFRGALMQRAVDPGIEEDHVEAPLPER